VLASRRGSSRLLRTSLWQIMLGLVVWTRWQGHLLSSALRGACHESSTDKSISLSAQGAQVAPAFVRPLAAGTIVLSVKDVHVKHAWA
jgi:hypothetical protein